MERRTFLKDTVRLTALTALSITAFKNKRLLGSDLGIKGNTIISKNKLYTMQNTIQTTVFQSKGKDIKVHAIQTGWISVKKNFLTKKGSGLFVKLNILLDHQYEDYMPIWVWVIEHPEGVIVIDTGDIEEADHKEFYKKEGMGSKFNLKAMSNKRKITKEDELNSQLAKLNIKPEQVSKVILTHLHGDHTDGLKFFPDHEIIVNELENKHPYGNLPTTYPTWFEPTLVNYTKNRVDIFDEAYPITKAEDLLLVPTPGHTHFHSSVLFKTDTAHILFAGDVSYKHDQVLSNTFGGSNIDYKKSQVTYDKIIQYATKYPTIYLPSHDEHSAKRLAETSFLIPRN